MNSVVLGAGIHDIPAAQYHADPAEQPSLSSSIAKLLCTSSPAHARVAHPRLNDLHVEREEERFDIGTVAHALLLQGDDIAVVCDYPDWRTAAAKEERSAARMAGQVPLLSKHWNAVKAMVAAAREQLDAHEASPSLFTDGKPERTIIWDEGGVTCRALIDWLRDDLTAIDDYKTAGASASPGAWARTMYGFGGDVQVAFYLRGLRAVTGVDADFRFVVQETSPPYALSVFELDASARALADEKVAHALAVWRRCVASDSWPAYSPKVARIEAPSWEMTRWLDREDEAA